MKAMSLHTIRILTVATAATLVGLTAAACQPSGESTAPAPTTSVQAAPTTSIQAPPTTTGGGGRVSTPPARSRATVPHTTSTATPTRTLRFPNTSADVVFVRYDAKNKLVAFQKVVRDPASPAANLVPDPRDPAIHELSMAPGTTVKPIDPRGFPFETCPPASCTVNNVMDSIIGHYNGAFWAHVHVNAADQIDSVAELAY